jgi:hypothetical protein
LLTNNPLVFLSLFLFFQIYYAYSYGGERYEKRDMQTRVRQQFSKLQAQDERQGLVPWHIVNAAQTIDDVQTEINAIVEQTIARVQQQQESVEEQPLQVLWQTFAENKESTEEN